MMPRNNKKFKAEWLTPKILVLSFSTQKEMCRTMLRFSEYNESPEFRGKPFTLSQFKRWYVRQYGKFNYYSQWVGFNQPSSELKAFLDGKFDPLTAAEQAVLDLIRHKKGRFCVIAHVKNDTKVLAHEVAHAMFYLHKDYRDACLRLVRRTPLASFLMSEISKIGYNKAVLEDELHAYLSDGSLIQTTGLHKYLNTKTIRRINRHGERLYKVFKKYAEIHGVTKKDQ
jgi:hypothetical protein